LKVQMLTYAVLQCNAKLQTGARSNRRCVYRLRGRS
jgi:ribosomal protein L40E